MTPVRSTPSGAPEPSRRGRGIRTRLAEARAATAARTRRSQAVADVDDLLREWAWYGDETHAHAAVDVILSAVARERLSVPAPRGPRSSEARWLS